MCTRGYVTGVAQGAFHWEETVHTHTYIHT